MIACGRCVTGYTLEDWRKLVDLGSKTVTVSKADGTKQQQFVYVRRCRVCGSDMQTSHDVLNEHSANMRAMPSL